MKLFCFIRFGLAFFAATLASRAAAEEIHYKYYCQGDVTYDAGFTAGGGPSGDDLYQYTDTLSSTVRFWVDEQGRVRVGLEDFDLSYFKAQGISTDDTKTYNPPGDVAAGELDTDTTLYSRGGYEAMAVVGGEFNLETGTYRLGIFDSPSPEAVVAPGAWLIHDYQYDKNGNLVPIYKVPLPMIGEGVCGVPFCMEMLMGCPSGEAGGTSWNVGSETALTSYYTDMTEASEVAEDDDAVDLGGVPVTDLTIPNTWYCDDSGQPCPVCGFYGKTEELAEDVLHLTGEGKAIYMAEWLSTAERPGVTITERKFGNHSVAYDWDITCAPVIIALDSDGAYDEQAKYEVDKKDEQLEFIPGYLTMEDFLMHAPLAALEMPQTVRVCVEALTDGLIGSSVDFALDEEKTTNFKGIAGNYPANGDSSLDYKVLDKSVTIDADRVACSDVEVRDYGGFATVLATVTVQGQEIELEIALPRDRDENLIADADPVNADCQSDPAQDNDNLKNLHENLGDGWSCAEERRGIIDKEGGFYKLDPQIKDLMIAHLNNTSGSGYLDVATAGVYVHEVLPDQLPDRVANFNPGPHHIQTQHGLLIKVEECPDCGGQAMCINCSAPWTPGNFSYLRIDPSVVNYSDENDLLEVIAHEIGHGVGIYHHGGKSFYDLGEAGDNIVTALNGGNYSGHETCFMRYSGASYYEKNGDLYNYYAILGYSSNGKPIYDKSEEEESDDILCNSPTGTGNNAPPERTRAEDASGEAASLPRVYDANEGDCLSQVHVKDPL